MTTYLIEIPTAPTNSILRNVSNCSFDADNTRYLVITCFESENIDSRKINEYLLSEDIPLPISDHKV